MVTVHIIQYNYTVNDKSLARERFRGLLDFIQMYRENFHSFVSFVLKVLPLLKVFVGKTCNYRTSAKTTRLSLV